MRISLDTSVIVDIERGKREVIKLLDELAFDDDNHIFISPLVLSEVFTCTYLRADYKKALKKAKELFSLFEIVSLDAQIAEIIGEINAYLIANGLSIEYQDVAIAATFLSGNGEYLLTENVEQFTRIPPLKKKVLRPGEFKNRA